MPEADSTPKVLLRPATPDDAHDIFELNQSLKAEDLYIVNEGLPDTESDERGYLEYLKPDKTLFLLATLDGKLVGYTLSLIGQFKMNAHVADIGISVRNGYRGKGIGTQLLKGTLQRLTKMGVKKATLSVFSPNKDANRFYRRLGFAAEGVRKKQWMFHHEYINEVIMFKWL
jgi:ribosomal protein S18 acetylase RimI-like enzyme